MAWDPAKKECFGFFSYGTGYFAPESQRRGEGSGYCDRCPLRQGCWEEHKARVEREDPAAVAQWNEALKFAESRGISGGQLAAMLAAKGTPDPWMTSVFANLQRGIDERHATNPPTKGR